MNNKHPICLLLLFITVTTWIPSCSNWEPSRCPNGNRCEPGYTCNSVNACIPTGETCGNGILDLDEQCDDGGDAPGDGCNQSCQREYCGNGTIEDGEVCDPPSNDLANYCSKGCAFGKQCGNLHKDPWETCDDGNTDSGDGCSGDCKSNERCGNGIKDAAQGEECDCGDTYESNMLAEERCSSALNSRTEGYCQTDCRLHCGDGVLADDEKCDDGSPLPLFCAEQQNGTITYDLGVASCNECSLVFTCQTITDSSQPSPVAEKLHGIWKARTGDIIAVGEKGVILRRSLSWTIENDRNGTGSGVTLFDVSGGGSPETILAVGASGTVLQREPDDNDNGFRWRDISPPGDSPNKIFYGVWISPSEDIFVVGEGGTIMHRPSGKDIWHTEEVTTDEVLYDVWGNDNGIFAVGASGVILRRDRRDPVTEPPSEAKWVKMPSHPAYDYRALWGDETAVYAVGASGRIIRFTDQDGWRIEESPADKTLTGIFGSSDNEIFAVGQGGTIIYRHDNIWSPVRSSSDRHFRDVSVAGRMVIAIDGGNEAIFSFTY